MKNLLYFTLFLFIFSCKEEDVIDNGPGNNPYTFGWDGNDDASKVPSKVVFGNGNSNLPKSVDLTSKFPPIGDQGQYGTCVGWATAYNVKTAINGIDNNYSTNDLKDSRNQFSPKDLFVSIDNNLKGANCNGTGFDNALDLIQNRGVATLSTVPYTNLGNCDKSQVQSSWTAEAASNKIKYYRKVDPKVNTIKEQLANNVPIILGAKLSDNFMSWNSDEVISSNTTYNNTGQHAYHALAILGYDDNKGPNGAFKVVNSWGQTWGSKGYIWVDYNFMVNDFQFNNNFYIAANEKGDGKKPDPNPGGSSADLAGWIFSDLSEYDNTGDPLARSTEFNIYNIGNSNISPATGWRIYYIYYNAYDADDYGVIFYDEFTQSIPSNTISCNGNNCKINYVVNSGKNLAEVLFGIGTLGIRQTYKMADITGDYYLLLLADGDDVIQEDDELNNLYYSSDEPIEFIDGYGELKSGTSQRTNSNKNFDFLNPLKATSSNIEQCKYHSAVNDKHRNAYTPEEIVQFVKYQKKSGQIDRMVKSLPKQNTKINAAK